MAVPIALPKLGWGTEPITLVEWKAREGDWIEQGASVLVITTGKITSDVEAEASGYLHILLFKQNVAPIGSVVGLIVDTKEELEALQRQSPKDLIARVAKVKEAPLAEDTPVQVEAKVKEGECILISPVARKMAQEHMIDIVGIIGTGPRGRIVREDIEKAIDAKKQAAAALDIYQGKRVKATIPVKGMRKVIAEHMHRSLSILMTIG